MCITIVFKYSLLQQIFKYLYMHRKFFILWLVVSFSLVIGGIILWSLLWKEKLQSKVPVAVAFFNTVSHSLLISIIFSTGFSSSILCLKFIHRNCLRILSKTQTLCSAVTTLSTVYTSSNVFVLVILVLILLLFRDWRASVL